MLAFALFAAAAAPAQTPVKLVSTTGQSVIAADASVDFAQAFTTGSNSGGYVLTRVDWKFKRDGTSAITLEDIVVEIRQDSSGNPGTVVATLTDPASLPNDGLAQFTAPGDGILLAANTTYFAVFDSSANSTDDVYYTTATAEDTGAAAGWSVADSLRWRIRTSTGWGNPNTWQRTMAIAVHGYALAPKLVGNTSRSVTKFESAASDWAQPFTTGSNASGYKLTRAELRMRGGSGTAPTYTASIHSDSSNSPGTSLGTLTNPAAWPSSAGPARHFAPSGGIDLTANTTYWLVFDITANATLSITEWLRSLTSQDAEDPGASTGWVIGDGGRNRTWNTATWGAVGTDSLMLSLHGNLNPNPPAVTDVRVVSTPPAGDTYRLGEEIQIGLTFGEAVTVDTSGGTPRLQIKMDPSFGEKWADYASGSGTATLRFDYTVVSMNRSPGGIAVLENTLQLNGGTIKSTASETAANLAHAGLPHNSDHKVDGSLQPEGTVPRQPDPPDLGPQQPQTDASDGNRQVRLDPQPLQLALWTDRSGYRAGETVRLYRTLDPHDDNGRYRTFAWLERTDGSERRYLAPLSAEGRLREEAVDARGLPASADVTGFLAAADRELAWQGPAPAPGLWQFVLELRPGSGPADAPDEGVSSGTRRAWARFVVAERSLLLNRRGFDREIRSDLTLRSDTVYHLLHQLFVHDGATLTIEPGTLVQAWGPNTAIIVERGGRIVAEGTPEAPVVLTCSAPAGWREPGCWAGLRILGRAPVTRLEGVAPGALPSERPVYGGADAEDSSGALRYVRVEFAGAGGDPDDPGAAGPAIGLYGAGSGTVLDHVQARASLGDGFAFAGGTAVCERCVASGSGGSGLSWRRGWRGGASHLYVQHGRGGLDGLAGGNDELGYDLEPRSRPALSNVTLVHASPYGSRARRAVALRLSAGSGVRVRDLLATGFLAGAVKAGGRSALLFGEGESSLSGALLYRNGGRPLQGVRRDAAEYIGRDPKLRDVRDFPNPDPRPKADSPALPGEGEGYIGAFDRTKNWLEKWTVFGPESVYDLRQREDEGN